MTKNSKEFYKNFFSGEIDTENELKYELNNELVEFLYYRNIFQGELYLSCEISDLHFTIENFMESMNELCKICRATVLSLTFNLNKSEYYHYIDEIIKGLDNSNNLLVVRRKLEVYIYCEKEYIEIIEKDSAFDVIEAHIFIENLNEINKYNKYYKSNVKNEYNISSDSLILSLKKVENYNLLKNNNVKVTDKRYCSDLINYLIEKGNEGEQMINGTKFFSNVCRFTRFNSFYINKKGELLKCDKYYCKEIVVGEMKEGHVTLDFNKIAHLILLKNNNCKNCYMYPTCYNKNCLLDNKKTVCPNSKKIIEENYKIVYEEDNSNL